jgi:hypothetical protein
LHGNTMKPLRHVRNQMLSFIRGLTCPHAGLISMALKSNSGRLQLLLLRMP